MSLRLGTDTGSLVNHLYSRMGKNAPMPVIGMGATIALWSDRHAATVTHYDTVKKIVTVQRDHAKRIDVNGMSDCQQYEYYEDKTGTVFYFRHNKHGSWVPVFFNDDTRRWNTSANSASLVLGFRNSYHDFSF